MTAAATARHGHRSKLRLALMAAVILLVAIAAVAPLLNASRFRNQIHRALETALNRRVSMGKVHFNVITGPGFTVEDVVIEDDPAVGIEPFAHVESLEARIRLASLWTGRMAFSKLKLVEPSVNFVKADSGPWNITALLNRAAAVNAGAHASMPDMQISSGRLNFKFGHTKSVFYVNNADLEVYPNQQGDLIIRFEGEPARTDHTAQGLGHLVARGSLRSTQSAGDELNMSVQLERTAITELTRLFDIQDIGVRGYVASNLKLNGPLNQVRVSGDLHIEDIHRWDLMPNKGVGWTLNYTGLLDLPAQQIDIETRSAGPEGSPVNGKFVASNYLSAPKWEASLNLHGVPAAALLDTARHMGAPFPAGATLDATLNGDIGYSHQNGVQGQLILEKGSFQLPQGAPTEFSVAPLQIKNNDVRFGPAEIRFDDTQSTQLEAVYALNTRALSLQLKTARLGLPETKSLIARWLGVGSVPLLEQCRQGTWTGSLTFERQEDGPGVWTGDMDVEATQLDLPGVSLPVRIASMSVQLLPGQTQISRLHGRIGTVAVDGDYRFFADPDRPDRMRLSIGVVQLGTLERLLLPTLNRQQGFLARALRLERTRLPDWLEARHIEGTIQVKDLEVGDASLGAAKARLIWTGSAIQLNGLEFVREQMQGAGKLSVSLSGAVPRYRLTGQVANVDYRNGTLDLEGALDSSGVGSDLGLNARAEGTFQGANISLAPDTQVEEVSGEYRLETGIAGPRLVLSKVELTQGQDVLRGQGVSQPDGRLVLELTTGHKQVRLTGMLLPVHPVAEP